MAAVAGTKRSFLAVESQAFDESPFAVAGTVHGDLRVGRASKQPDLRATRRSLDTNSPDDDLVIESAGASPAPVAVPFPANLRRHFAQDASIVLLGVRGSGKSTLGIIASTFCQRRLIETQFALQEAFGCSSAAYKVLHGSAEHRRKQTEVLTDILTKNEKGCIIICGLEAVDRSCQALIREYCKTHPVIRILRDEDSIHNYLSTLRRGKVEELVRASNAVLGSCSNYDFFNASENTRQGYEQNEWQTSTTARRISPFLGLKRAERHFLNFVTLLSGKGRLFHFESAFPLSNVPVEHRRYTYAVSVPLSQMLGGRLDIEQVESGSDAFEIAIDIEPDDLQRISQVLADIRRNTVVPIIFHVDRSKLQNVSQYASLVHHGLRLAPEAITLDLTVDDQTLQAIMAARGSAKIIGEANFDSSDAPDWKMDYWVNICRRAVSLGCDLIRLSKPGRSVDDQFAVGRFCEKLGDILSRPIPIIAYDTGPIGRTSATFNEVLTPVTHEALRNGHITPRASLTAREATKALSSAFVFDPMKFYIIGASVTYSLSPAMHNAGYKQYGLRHQYEIRQTPTLDNVKELFKDSQFGGASVTLPFKLEIIALTHSLSKHAKAIGAVNTLIPVRQLNEDGSIPDNLTVLRGTNRAGPVKALLGENTDWIGIRACIRRGLSPVNAVRAQSTALVAGAGGMARAAVYALLQLGLKNIFVYNRTVSKAEDLTLYFQQLVAGANGQLDSFTADVKQNFADVSFHVMNSLDQPWLTPYRQPTILISCVPTHKIGDKPAPNFTMPPQWLHSPTGGVVLEVAYQTLHTPLLEQIRAEAHRGWVAMDGLDLLPEQAFAQFELFTARRAPRRLMREEVLRKYQDGLGIKNPDLIQSRLALIHEQEP